MVARVQVLAGSSTPGRARPLVVSRGNIEAIKWLAFALMIACHTARYLFDVTDGWLLALGEMCFPLFAFAFAAAVSADTEEKSYRAAFLLLPFAIATQLFAQPVRDSGLLNMLFLYVAAAAWLSAPMLHGDVLSSWHNRAAEFYVIRLLAVAVAALSEFGMQGLGVIVCLTRYCEGRGNVWLMLAAASQALYAVAWGAWWSYGAVLVVLLVWCADIRVPRLGGMFRWAYTLQWPLFWLVR